MLAQTYKLRTGDAAPNFDQLPGVDGGLHSLADYADSKALVIVFSCNHCPYVQAYEGRMKAVHGDYSDKGVAMVAISSNDAEQYPEDSFDEMKARAQRMGFGFDYLYDQTQATAKAYGAQCTPHVFVFGADRTLTYQGRFDDRRDDPEAGNASDLRAALDATLAGRTVPNPQTQAFGCSVKWNHSNLAIQLD